MTEKDTSTPPRRRSWFDRQTVAISVIYTSAWFLMLFNGGRYWDDWTLYRLSVPTAFTYGDQVGQVWQPFYWLALSWWPGAEYLSHVLTFLLFLAAALFLNRILRRVPGLDDTALTLIPALFAVFPANAARFAHIDFQYTLSVAVFYLAWYLIALDLDRPRVWKLVLSGLLFASAMFTTNSMLMFVVLVPLYVAWVRAGDLRDRSARLRLAARYGFLIVLPVLVYALRKVAFRPWGPYEGYNQVKFEQLSWAAKTVPLALWTSFIAPTFTVLPWLVLVVVVVMLVRRQREEPASAALQNFVLIGGGLLALVLAVFPYLAVGKLPQPLGADGWDSRHAVLVPLGAALVIYGLVMLLGGALRLERAVLVTLLSVLLTGFIVTDIQSSLDYQAEWYKQVSLMQHMKENPDVREGNYFVVYDKALELNAAGRVFQPYEFTGMMLRVFGDSTRFASDSSNIDIWGKIYPDFQKYEQYHYGDFEGPPRAYKIVVTPGTADVTRTRTVIKLLLAEMFDRQRFERMVGNVVNVETEPLEELIPPKP